MQVNRTDISNTKVKLTISAKASDLQTVKDQVVARLGKDVKLQGFRPGKAPKDLIEKNIDHSLLQADFLDEAMTQLYAQATKQENIRPVTRPEVNVKKFVPFTDLEYEVTTDVIGKITLPDYRKVKVEKPKIDITAKDINDVLKSLQERMAEKSPVDRAAKSGDEAVIDFKGVDSDKKPINGAEGRDYPLSLGSNVFIPGFEDNVIGMKVGEDKTFTLTFPKDYGVKALANKKVTFTVTLKQLNELKLPDLNDEFAAKIGPFKSVDELKNDIKQQLKIEREREAQSSYENDLVKAVTDKSKVDMPKALIEQQITYSIDDLRRNLTYRGQTYQEFLEAEGKTEDEYKKEIEPQAIQQLKTSLVLAEIADKEDLAIGADELKVRIDLYKQQYTDPAMQAELDKPENQRDIASRMLTEKVVSILGNPEK